MFTFKRVGVGTTPCYTVLGADRTVMGQVCQQKSSQSWRAEDPEGAKDFPTRDDAAFWLVGRHALRIPPTSRVLAFDPTPAGLIKKPLRKEHKSLWARLRQERFKGGGLSCDICRANGTKKELIDAHEVYSFPNTKTVYLDKVIFVCRPCHYSIHFERTAGRCTDSYTMQIKEHYMNVNGGLSREEFDRDFDQSQRRALGLREFYRDTERSVTLNFGRYQSHVDALAEKRKLRSERPAYCDDDDDDFEMYPDHECPWDIGRAG